MPYTRGRLSCTDAMDPEQYASLGMLNEMGALVDATLTVYKVENNPTTGNSD